MKVPDEFRRGTRIRAPNMPKSLDLVGKLVTFIGDSRIKADLLGQFAKTTSGDNGQELDTPMVLVPILQVQIPTFFNFGLVFKADRFADQVIEKIGVSFFSGQIASV